MTNKNSVYKTGEKAKLENLDKWILDLANEIKTLRTELAEHINSCTCKNHTSRISHQLSDDMVINNYGESISKKNDDLFRASVINVVENFNKIKESRSSNIVILGLEESNGLTSDLDHIYSIFDYLKQERPYSFKRLMKRDMTSTYPRPILVKLKDASAVKSILSIAKNIKNHVGYDKVFLNADLSYLERKNQSISRKFNKNKKIINNVDAPNLEFQISENNNISAASINNTLISNTENNKDTKIVVTDKNKTFKSLHSQKSASNLNNSRNNSSNTNSNTKANNSYNLRKPQLKKAGNSLTNINNKSNNPVNVIEISPKSQNINNPNIVVSIGGLNILQTDINRLNPGELLNDNIIDVYLKLICLTFKHCVALSSCWYQKVAKKEKPWLSKMTNFNKVLIPICNGNHWMLVVFDCLINSITFFDSLNNKNANSTIINKCKIYISATFPSLKDIDWKISKVDVAKQNNVIDCGVYLCIFARLVATGE